MAYQERKKKKKKKELDSVSLFIATEYWVLSTGENKAVESEAQHTVSGVEHNGTATHYGEAH